MGVATLLALWLAAGVLAAGVPPGDDSMAHVLRVQFVLDDLLPAGHLDGWQPQTALGHRAFLFYGPGHAWTAAALCVLSLGALSALGAVKALAVASYAALPAAVAFLARSFGLDRRASGLAAVLSLCVASCCGGVGIPGLFEIGLLPHALGAIPALVALGGAMRLCAAPRRRWLVVTALALAAAMITHPISAIVLAALWLLILPTLARTDRPTPQAVGWLAAAVALAAALAGIWLVPALAHRDLRGLLTGWPVPTLRERFTELASGRSFLRGYATLALAAAGWLFCVGWLRARRRWALALLTCPIAYLLLAELLRRWNPIHVVTMQIGSRGLGYVGVIALLPAAALLARGADRLGRAGTPLALGIAVAAALAAAGPLRPLARTDLPTRDLEALAQQIEQHVPPGARFAAQVDPLQRQITGVRWPAGWLAFASHRSILDFFNSESSQVEPSLIAATDALVTAPPDEMADLLTRLGVSHVALVRPDAARALVASDRFRTVWQSPGLALLAVVPRPGVPGPASLVATEAPADARLHHAEAEHLEIELDARSETTATVAVGWSPQWHATLDGSPVASWRSHEGLLRVRVPAGVHAIGLRYTRDRWDSAGLGATLLGFTALLGAARRRGTPMGGSAFGAPGR